jgi:hypothetical protein
LASASTSRPWHVRHEVPSRWCARPDLTQLILGVAVWRFHGRGAQRLRWRRLRHSLGGRGEYALFGLCLIASTSCKSSMCFVSERRLPGQLCGCRLEFPVRSGAKRKVADLLRALLTSSSQLGLCIAQYQFRSDMRADLELEFARHAECICEEMHSKHGTRIWVYLTVHVQAFGQKSS